MNKKEIISEIKNVVLTNSKNGKATPTIFVGTYNYKSGFDTYFAVSLNQDKELIVYSNYQNDRGECLDVYEKKLSSLPEKELNEVYENLGKKNKDTKYMFTDEFNGKVKAVLEHIRMYAPKKKTSGKTINYDIDLDKIPNLESDKDMYYIDRKHNVGILKYIGDNLLSSGTRIENGKSFPIVERLYSYNGKCIHFDEWYRDKPSFEDYDYYGKPMTNKGCFAVLDDDDKNGYRIIVVPNKEHLKKLFDQAKNVNKKYYCINKETLNTFEKNGKDVLIFKNQAKYLAFESKEEAIAKLNELKEIALNKFHKQISTLNEHFDELKNVYETYKTRKPTSLNAKDAEIGETYSADDCKKKLVTVSGKDEFGNLLIKNCNGLVPYNRIIYKFVDKPYDGKLMGKIYRDYDYATLLKSKLKGYVERINKYVPFLGEDFWANADEMEKEITSLLNDLEEFKNNL